MNSKTITRAASKLDFAVIAGGLVVQAPRDARVGAMFSIVGERLPLSSSTAVILQSGDADPRQSGAYSWEDVRALRDALLSATDARMVADYAQSSSEKAAWRAYRQSLRDLTESYQTPTAVQWPTPPDAMMES